MNNSRQTARDLVAAYDHSLEQQIVGRGSNLACRDEELFNQVEELLRDRDAQEIHCLGLDPLRVMEESLMDAAVKARGELQGLAKAFEILEQAALNLYLGPWREEYKVVKMYSGMFTHYIKSVLSMPQIEKLFGLLGYQPSVSRQEQLRLQSSRVSPVSADNLLRLSCGFFLARCECRLLLTALESHAGEPDWELSVVRERQKGHSLQVALETTRKTLKANNPAKEPIDGEGDVDLYTDEQVNGGQRESGVLLDSSSWVPENGASPEALKIQSNGMTSLPPMSTSLPIRDHVCISTLNCQLTKTSPVELERSCSASKRQGRRGCEGSTFDKADFQSQPISLLCGAKGVSKRRTDTNICSCLQFPSHLCNKHCVECKTLHRTTCALLEHCIEEGHTVVTDDITGKELNESGAVSPHSETLGVSDMSPSQTLIVSSTAIPSLVPCDSPKSIIASLHPISYHECCNLALLDPQFLCVSCGAFHSNSCSDRDYCSVHHTVKKLGICICGKLCPRTPLVLCRYCGNEYCTDCWYRNPVVCQCGQTFDQSSSV